MALLGSLASRSPVAAVSLTLPLAWALAPGARGIAGSLVTLLLAVLAASLGDEGDGARTVRTVSAVATATPVAWGLAAAAVGASPGAPLSVLAVALIAWGWWRVVSKSSQQQQQPSDEPRRQEREQERERWHRQQWGGSARGGEQRQQQQARRTTDHLPGEAPPGATDDVELVLSARNYLGVLGLLGGGSGEIARASLTRLDDEAVRAAWRKLALSVHPDKHRGVGAEDAFDLVTKAYESLQDAGARASYARVLGLG